MKPLPDLGSSELRDLASAISQDICSSSPGVAWGDVAGLDGAKHLLREALVMPLQFPDIFTGILAPWKVRITVSVPIVSHMVHYLSHPSHEGGDEFVRNVTWLSRIVMRHSWARPGLEAGSVSCICICCYGSMSAWLVHCHVMWHGHLSLW